MHREVLTEAAVPLFPLLARFPGFYLAGGTALALQIGHRASVDFDLFSNAPVDRALLARARQIFTDAAIMPLVNNADELTAIVNGVKITFLHYPFPTLDAFVICERVSLLSVSEIAATKAYTIGRRGSYKDYVDLYFVLAEGHSTLRDIIADAEQKFGSEFNARLFLEQLVYLDDLDDTEIEFVKHPVSPEVIESFFEERIRSFGPGL
jgi:Nucleotidyl transferase AbiEii toxin, Type IV TA system